jgi:lipopolysaccharide biosynthesis glycosyltransferase
MTTAGKFAQRSVTLATLADQNYFAGLVCTLASGLRAVEAVGYRCRMLVVDAGLTPEQAEMLKAAGVGLASPDTSAASPIYLKPTFVPMVLDAGTDVVIYLDADAIILGDLSAVMASSAGGAFVALRDGLPDRYCPEWNPSQTIARPGTNYVNAGFFVANRGHADLLQLWKRNCARVQHLETVKERWIEHPWMFGDQDVLNAILRERSSRIEISVLDGQPTPVIDPLGESGFLGWDETTGSPTWRGHPITVWHFAGERKPWEIGTTQSLEYEIARRTWRRAALGADQLFPDWRTASAAHAL